MDAETVKVARSYYNTFSTGDGIIVLEDLVRSFYDRCSVDEYNPDPHLTAFREGQRSVVLLLKALMAQGMVSPERKE